MGKTIINSKRRFDYIEAQKVLDSGKGEYFEELKVLTDIADKLEIKRVKNGSIQFNSTEVKFKLDENKFPVEIYQKEHVHTMDLIEEFALLTNRSISRFASADSNLKRNENPFIFRIHDEPKQEKVSEVISFLNKLGRPADLNVDGKLSAAEMNKILKESKGTPEEGILSLSILRTMQKAIYGTEARGHFGLAFKYYSHFTSPIRRYPDMIAHRLLLKYLNNENVKESENTKILKLANHSSEMELKAVSAERESIAFKQAQYYSVRVGEKFFGIISGIKKFGFFVENIETKASGMINIRNIGDDFFVYDEKNQSIKGQKSGKIYKLGDKVEAKVLDVNIETRKIDLTLK
jgi:ribonuclease R